ncbi:transposase [Nonomuraea sp. NPDC046570]|uniref:IS66 family transposase n=1 Tax=Nonomuraea sp. NPDC046570 TaxID=3155255 RepID=UPI0033EE2EA6
MARLTTRGLVRCGDRTWGWASPTNNQAERDLRPAKTQQKISGRLRSERATEQRYAVCGYLSTALKYGAAQPHPRR